MAENNSDPRHAEIRAYILRAYQECLGIPSPPWNGRDGAALKRLLRENKKWDVDFIKGMVKNKFYSAEAVGPAWEWLPRLIRYSEGPLDRFGKVER